MPLLRFGFSILLFVSCFSELRAQEMPSDIHQHTIAPSNARYEIVQSEISAKWMFRLDRFTGHISQLVKNKTGDNSWESMAVLGLPVITASETPRPRFQILASGLSFKFTFLIDTDTGKTWQLTTDAKLIQPGAQTAAYAPPGYLLFIRGGTLMEQPFDLGALSVSGDPSAIAVGVENFSVSETGTLVYTSSATAINHLVWVDRAGKQISEAAPPGEYDDMQLSREGKRVAFDRTNSGNLNIWIRDLERGIQSRLTFQQSNVPQWSPDGSTLVFAWIGSGGIDLGERPTNMSDSEKVLVKLSAPPIMFPSDWSSDGRYLVY